MRAVSPFSRSARAMFAGSAAVAATALVTAAGSALFWARAAHVAPQHDVGVVAAMTSAVLFLTSVAAAGFVPAVARHGSGDAPSDMVIFNHFAAIAVGASTVLGALTTGVVATVGVTELEPLRHPGGALAFIVVSAGGALTILVEIRLLARQRYKWMIGRAAVVSLVSLGLLLFRPVAESPLRLFMASLGPTVVAAPIVWYFGDLRRTGRMSLRPLPAHAPAIFRFARVGVVATIFSRLPWMGMPIVTAVLVDSDANARFYVAWSIALVFYLSVQSVSVALLTQGDREQTLEAALRSALALGAALSVAGIVAIGIGAPLVRAVYGDDYGESVRVVRLLSLAAAPILVYSVTSTTMLVRDLERLIVVLPMVFAACTLLPVVALAPGHSIVGAAAGWLIGATIAGVVGAIVLRQVLATGRRGRLASTFLDASQPS